MRDYRNLVVIHQPDFMPWSGFFQKLLKADTFILLDHVTNHPKAPNWLRRVKILQNREPRWLSLPLLSVSSETFVPIYELELNASHPIFRTKAQKSIEMNYSRAPYYEDVIPLVHNYFQQDGSTNLSERNMGFIRAVVHQMGCAMPPVVRSSSLSSEGSKTDLLVTLTREVDGDAFLLSGGVDQYFQATLFENAGIDLVPQDFVHPVYEHFNRREFVPGLSIVDVLMNCGYSETRAMITTA